MGNREFDNDGGYAVDKDSRSRAEIGPDRLGRRSVATRLTQCFQDGVAFRQHSLEIRLLRFFFPRWPYFQQVLEPCSDRLPCCLVRVCSNRQAGSGGNANEEARGTFRLAVLTIGQPMKFATRLGSVRAALAAAFAVSFALVDAAQARLLSWPQFGSWWGVHSSPRHGHRRQPKPASTTTDQAAEIPDGPLQIIISIPDQRISVYDNDALIARSSVSTGVRGHPTPLGVFSVIARRFPPFRIVTVPCSRHVFRPLRRDETGKDRAIGKPAGDLFHRRKHARQPGRWPGTARCKYVLHVDTEMNGTVRWRPVVQIERHG